MSWQTFVFPLLGGILIGAASSLLLVMNGRIFGVSGILSGLLVPRKGETAWRVSILLGLLTAGGLLMWRHPTALTFDLAPSSLLYITAGLLVGFGTALGGGCTSGHGVCGLSRLSPRSIIATLTFMGSGMLTVWIVRHLGGW